VFVFLNVHTRFRYAALQAARLPVSPLQITKEASSSNDNKTNSAANNRSGSGEKEEGESSGNNNNDDESALDLPPTAEELAQRAAALDARRAEDARREEIAFKASFLMQQVSYYFMHTFYPFLFL
jgi:hypothetical protein